MPLPTFDSPTLEGTLVDDGNGGVTMKGRHRQQVKFYLKRQMDFRAKTHAGSSGDGKDVILDSKTGLPVIDKKTGLPFKETFQKETLMVIIDTPGDKNKIDCVATDYHKREFYRQYEYFRKGKGIPEGYSIDDCEWIQPSTLTELHYYGIHVVEQLAVCTDLICEQVPEVWELREFANDWLKINSPDGQKAKNIELQSKLDEANATIEDLKSRIVGADGKPMRLNKAPVVREAIRTMEVDRDEIVKPAAMEVEETPKAPKTAKKKSTGKKK